MNSEPSSNEELPSRFAMGIANQKMREYAR